MVEYTSAKRKVVTVLRSAALGGAAQLGPVPLDAMSVDDCWYWAPRLDRPPPYEVAACIDYERKPPSRINYV